MRAERLVPREVPDTRRGAAHLDDRLGCLAFVADEASETTLRGGLANILGTLQFRRGDVRTATRALEREATPHTLLVDISGITDPLLALEELAAVCTPDVRVLVIGEQSDIGFYRRLVRDINVAEYLHKPLTRDMVARLFGPYLNSEAASAAAEALRHGSKVVAVCGARGGSGASTVAVNLAVELAEISHGHVVLLDLHLRGGTTGIMLGVRSGTGLRVALEDPDRVDNLFLDRVGTPISDRMRLIAAEEPMEAMPKPAEAGVQRLLEMLRQRFNYVIVDMPMPPGLAERMVLSIARISALVMGPDIVSIRDTLALKKLVAATGTSQVMTVLNRAGLPGALKPKLIEEGLGAVPEIVIPDLPRQVPRAVNLGRPATRDSAALRRALAPLVQEIAPVQTIRAPAPSLFGRLLGRGRA